MQSFCTTKLLFVETYESNSLEREPVLVLVRHLVIEVLPKFNEFGTIDDSYIFLAVAGFSPGFMPSMQHDADEMRRGMKSWSTIHSSLRP